MKMTKRALAKQAQVTADSQKLLAYMDREGFDGGTGIRRTRNHMGGLIVESAMQAGQSYEIKVVPRVNEIIQAWPDADTTTGFLNRIATGNLSETVRWPEGNRLDQMKSTAELLATEGIDTVGQLRERFATEPSRTELRQALRRIGGIGKKTVNFIEIMAGSQKVAAIDVRILRATDRAGIEDTGYDYLHSVLEHAAAERGWKVGSLDVVLWDTHPA